MNDIDQCYRIKLFFEQFGIRACVLNAELPLKSRLHIVDEFNRGSYDYVIATDQTDSLLDEEVSEAEQQTIEGEKEEETIIKKKRVDLKGKSKKTKIDKEYGSSRGLDFKNVQSVINFDLPNTSRAYMHRVGRTARGLGKDGFSLSFVSTDSPDNIKIQKRNDEGNVISRDEYMMHRIEKKQTRMFLLLNDFM